VSNIDMPISEGIVLWLACVLAPSKSTLMSRIPGMEVNNNSKKLQGL
jgi:hypothetical protein